MVTFERQMDAVEQSIRPLHKGRHSHTMKESW
jgi:hypothetical protein